MINFRSVDNLNRIIKSKLHLVPNVDCIAGVPRSGMLAASLIALYLRKPLISVEQLEQNHCSAYTNRVHLDKTIKRVLVVDDSCSSGNAINQVKNMLSPIKDKEFIYCAVYVLESSKKYVDFYFDVVEHLRLFEWNIMDHSVMLNSCVDLDGVLCVDPTIEQNDDGNRYLQFIREATPKFIPQHEIKAIVTCRLEKYRVETEGWLQRHGVKYDHLFMMNYPDMLARLKANNYAQYKADIYNQTKTILFYESNVSQAEKIYQITGKPVYCIDNNKLYGN